MKRSSLILSVFSIAVLFATSRATDTWVDISTSFIASKGLTPGYCGPVTACASNRLTGDFYMLIPDLGIWKSADKGMTYARVDNSMVSGRGHASTFDMDIADPKRMCAFTVYGQSAYTLDGTTWTALTKGHLDFGSVDWSVPSPKTIITTAHESGGQVWLSTDGGTSWAGLSIKVPASYGNIQTGMLGVLDATTLIYSNGNGIFRSADLGSTWTKVSSINPLTWTPKIFKGVIYLGGASGLIVSKDKGQTWQNQGSSVNVWQGPFFGTDENTMVIAGRSGVYKSTNAGSTWTLISGLKTPTADFDPTWYGAYTWEPVNNCLYAARCLFPAFKNQIAPTAVSQKKLPGTPVNGVTIVNSIIRSGAPFDNVEIVALSGRVEYHCHMPSSTWARIPRLSAMKGLPLVVKLSTVQGDVFQYTIMP